MFAVSYEITTPESAENGDSEELGFIADCVGLREAIGDLFGTRTSEVEGVESVECNEYPVISPRWITVYNGGEFRTGARESRSLHIPERVTPSTRRRIARLVGAMK